MKPLGDFITRRIVTAVLFGVGVRRKGAGHDIHYKHIPIRQLGGRIRQRRDRRTLSSRICHIGQRL